MLLVAVGLTPALLDRLAIAEVPAWEAVGSAALAPEEAHVLAEAHVVVAVVDVEGRQTID
jgi:hypothetical protein